MTVWFDNITQNSNVLDFDVVGVDTSVANAIRRSILTNIPNVGFCHEPEEKCTITVKKNTTALHDEFISHRIRTNIHFFGNQYYTSVYNFRSFLFTFST